MVFLRALLGIAFFIGASWLLSSHRDRFPWRVVGYGILLQVALAFFCLETSVGVAFFQGIAGFVTHLIAMTQPGAQLVFGHLADVNNAEGGWGYAFAFASSGLTVIIFFSALMAVLYHLGVMQILVYGIARVMTALMGVSGAESLAMAANIFVGQTEAPLVVRPYIPRMTRSEINALMTGGFATIAGSVLAVYMGMLGNHLGPHLLTASVMSAPAAFLVAKIMQPEVEESVTGPHVELRIERTASNVVEAAAIGTGDGLKLWLNVIAMLIAFLGLVALINWPLGWLGTRLGVAGGLSLEHVFGWIFSPIAWLMGVQGWNDCQLFGSLFGTKIAINEFVAFQSLSEIVHPSGAAAEATRAVFAHARSATMATYALCGFSNFASVGIQIGGISPLAPEKRGVISSLAFRAMLGGAFASCMTATIAGVFLS